MVKKEPSVIRNYYRENFQEPDFEKVCNVIKNQSIKQ
jgi:hypothetical protein